MNGKAFLKNILLFIMFMISIFFILITNKSIGLRGIGTRPLIIPITLSLNFLLLEKRTKQKKLLKISFIFLSILNSTWFLYHIYELISHYIKWNYLELDITYIYLNMITIMFITSLKDTKKETNSLNDILTIITTILLILIHYRYYLDKNLLHNIINNSNDINILQNRYIYITQYYPHFIFMYLILFIHKKITNKKNELQS